MFKNKPKSGYGEYETCAFTQDTSPVQEVVLPHESCKDCRDKNKMNNKVRRARSDTSTGVTSDDKGCVEYESDCYHDGCVEYESDCYHDGCVEYGSDGDMVGFK